MLEQELYLLQKQQEEEINLYLDSFIGKKYGFWPFLKKIKNHEDVHKFFKKHPHFRDKIVEIEDKYHDLSNLVSYEHGIR